MVAALEVGLLVFGASQNDLDESLSTYIYSQSFSLIRSCTLNPYGSFLIAVDAQRVTGAQEAPWCSLETYAGW